LPDQAKRSGEEAGRGVPLKDFDASRDEVVAEIRPAPTRRADNLVSDLLTQARCLSMHGQVCESVARHFRNLQYKIWGALSAIVVLGVLGAVLSRQAASWTTPAAFAVGSLALAVAGWFGGRAYLRLRSSRLTTAEGVDPFFETAYLRELTWQDRADLRALWERVRPKLLNSVTLLGAGGLATGFSFRRQLRRLDTLIETDIPKLRRRLETTEG